MARTEQAIMLPSERTASRVAIRRVAGYDADLRAVITETLREFSLPIQGKTILLKPNLVSSDPGGAVATHAAVIGAAKEAFLRLGAAKVLVGEGPALERDTEMILESAGLREQIGPLAENFIDLNLDEAHKVRLRTRASRLSELYFPQSVLRADYIVSMPKLKTHHWAGVTLSLKNMFGIVPGCCYGWPKNVLHWAGIGQSILDINSTIRPDFAIVDGIIGMEGNGPVQGNSKTSGVLVLGDDPVAVDATCCRIMKLRPEKVDYLRKAAHLLGHIQEGRICQLGESIQQVQTPFEVIKDFEYLRAR